MARPAFGEWHVSPDDHELLASIGHGNDEHVIVVRAFVNDGWLRAVATQNPHWRLELAHWPRRKRRARRLPTWAELVHAREQLVPENVQLATIIPHADEVITDPTLIAFEIPLPPPERRPPPPPLPRRHLPPPPQSEGDPPG